MIFIDNQYDMKKKNIMVSLFDSFDKPYPRGEVDLFEWFFTEKIKGTVKCTRKYKDDKEKYKEYKACMPCITPSGIFKKRTEKDLKKHSGYICIDIDGKDNPDISDFRMLRDALSKIENVAFSALSLSENGVFCFIPIQYPDRHKDHYKMIVEDFQRLGIKIDAACSNLSRLRAASYDPDAYINYDAVPYTRLYDEKIKTPSKRSRRKKGNYKYGENDALYIIEKIVSKIEDDGVDITANYENWFQIACALVKELGEEGRDYFHRISSCNENYDAAKTDETYDESLKKNGYAYTLGSLIFFAKENSLL